jgi:hypothetical protein
MPIIGVTRIRLPVAPATQADAALDDLLKLT